VVEGNRPQIEASDVLTRQGLSAGKYFLVSLHREENVDNPARLAQALEALRAVAATYELPVLVSTHPRTRNRLEQQPESSKAGLIFHPPFGFNDYVKLQLEAKLVLSDSGTIAEESSILGFPAITLRDAIERPEAIDGGAIITAGVTKESVINSIQYALQSVSRVSVPAEYMIDNTSVRVVNFIKSTHHSHVSRTGLRQ
jgi:UDP-N-acetylglucosamine 2-epimerase (non-hydrolysing)